MFGRNSSTATVPSEVVDESGTPVVETITTPDEEERTHRIMTRRSSWRREPPADESLTATRPVVADGSPVVPETVIAPDLDVKRWVHVSATATLSLIAGTLAIAATLTGLLAPVGFAAGIVAILLGVIGFASAVRPHITGHSLAVFGIVAGMVAVVLSMLAMSNDLSWLSKDTNEIAVVHGWLNDHMHWLRRF